MTASDLRAETPLPAALTAAVSPTRILASALLHVLDRDEPLPPRWRAESFVRAVARHRAVLDGIVVVGHLDPLASVSTPAASFQGAVNLLASDALAAAFAVRRLELARGSSLPAWPVLVRHGVAPRIPADEAARWFG